MAAYAGTVIDCHVHPGQREGVAASAQSVEALAGNLRAAGIARAGLVCTFHSTKVTANPGAFIAKHLRPELFYLLPGLDHSAHISGGELSPPPLAEQLDRLLALGADGLKLIATKPTHRKVVDRPVDGPYWADFFARAEERGALLLWHVADPEEFWDERACPRWAQEQGWGYDGSFIAKEALYAEVAGVLARHPGLRFIFPHFYFLSADLPRAAKLLAEHPNAHLDLAPGIELLYNLSREREAAREFFVEHAGRILFGTDIAGSLTPEQSAERAGLVRRFLETGDEFRLGENSDELLGPAAEGVIRGLDLPFEALRQIYRGNFERLAGARPRPLDASLAREECLRLAAEADALGAGDNPARRAAELLAG